MMLALICGKYLHEESLHVGDYLHGNHLPGEYPHQATTGSQNDMDIRQTL